ncbi:hypothetical protein [Halorussus marinus]|uniref:hypothetical protein n=1 Tax=Halorussus marinus TaxID=2505976 RepID=UPI001093328A|nr:hypothetical protein [Halorussus marinus]
MTDTARLKDVVEILGIFSMFGLSVFAYLAWWLAFHNGGTVRIDVTAFGELWLEYLLWLVVTPLITLGLYYYVERGGRSG